MLIPIFGGVRGAKLVDEPFLPWSHPEKCYLCLNTA